MIQMLNLEFNMPTNNEAIKLLQKNISVAKNKNVDCIYIIHGYGSHGVGGSIKIEVRKYLENELGKGNIKRVIYGEDFKITNIYAYNLRHKYNELEYLFHRKNIGVTVIEL